MKYPCSTGCTNTYENTLDGKNKATISHNGELLFNLTLRNRKLKQDQEGRYLVYNAYESNDDDEWEVYLYESGKILLSRSSNLSNLIFIYNDAEYEEQYK